MDINKSNNKARRRSRFDFSDSDEDDLVQPSSDKAAPFTISMGSINRESQGIFSSSVCSLFPVHGESSNKYMIPKTSQLLLEKAQNASSKDKYPTAIGTISCDINSVEDNAEEKATHSSRKRAASPSSSSSSSSASSSTKTKLPLSSSSKIIDLISPVIHDDEDVEEDREIPLFRIISKIVGLQYYSGRANVGELVHLIREPENDYDCNAIRVMDLSQSKVGHIAAKDGTAGGLAPILDRKVRGSLGGSLEATVIDASNFHSASVQIIVLGLPEHKTQLSAHLDNRHLGFIDIETGAPSKYYSPPGGAGGKALKALQKRSATSAKYTVLSAEEVQSALDAVWDETDSQVSGLAITGVTLEALNRCLQSELHPHQRQGVAWMLQQERPDQETLPPFYSIEQSGSTMLYRHSVTLHDEKERPVNSRGGLLLDDMGLGKSIQILSLVVCNPPAGTSYRPSHDCSINSAPEIHRPTLIVCPVSVASAWIDQIDTHFYEGSLTSLLYHGSRRSTNRKEISSFDVVVTTYEILANDLHQGPLMGIHWHRVVFDEAHVARNTSTLKFKACLAVKADHHWCLSGTPICNTVTDLDALIQLVRLQPFGKMKGLFNSSISKKVKLGDPVAIANLRVLMKRISLRRLKHNIMEVNLSQKIETNVSIRFSTSELNAYCAIKAAIDDYVSFMDQLGADSILRNSSTVLAFITRLRQCCLDVRLIPAAALVNLLSFHSGGAASAGALARLTDEQQAILLQKFESVFADAGVNFSESSSGKNDDEAVLECCICFGEVKDDLVVLRFCMHMFCSTCVVKLFNRDQKIACPMCRRITSKDECVTYLDLQASIASSKEKAIDDSSNESKVVDAANKVQQDSSKTFEIIKAVDSILHDKDTEDDKIVIFSNFTSYLQILQSALEKKGVSSVSITGGMTQPLRSKAVRLFSSDSRVKVILCSVKAAGTGITLTAANHIFICDVWWSPAVDNQAIDRVHRIGQKKIVHVYRFLMENSIDEKILQLQRRKSDQMVLTFERSVESARSQRINDFHTLLS